MTFFVDAMTPLTEFEGICIKTNKADDSKVFINLCFAEEVLLCETCRSPGQIPSPPSISDDQLTEALLTMNSSLYRVPMSVGPGHAELDNSPS